MIGLLYHRGAGRHPKAKWESGTKAGWPGVKVPDTDWPRRSEAPYPGMARPRSRRTEMMYQWIGSHGVPTWSTERQELEPLSC